MTTLLSEVRDGKTHRCDATCHRALAPRCKCICGGRLHGREHAGTLKQDYEALLEEKEPHLFDRKTMRVTSMPEMIEFLRIGDETTVIIGGRRLDLPTLGPGETRHSPDGFEWGYGGSGPAELARALLIAVCPADAAARHPACYQMFKEAFVAHVPTTWSMPTSMVRAWYVTWAATPFGHKVQEWIEARDTLKEVPDGA